MDETRRGMVELKCEIGEVCDRNMNKLLMEIDDAEK